MAVLTHMVGRLGSLAIQDSHIQAVLYALLQKGLEGSPAEQEVLVEDAVKLLNATLSASSSLEPPLQVCWCVVECLHCDASSDKCCLVCSQESIMVRTYVKRETSSKT